MRPGNDARIVRTRGEEDAMHRGSNLLRLADYNQAVVLDLIRRSPGQSRADLQRNSGLASQTISNITRRLIDAELIRESRPIDIPRGRPSIPLSVSADGAYAVGVHIDPTRLTLLLLDVAGDVRHQLQLPTPQATNPADVTSLIAVSTGRLIREAGIDRDRVLGLGIAAPGPLDVTRGIVVDPPQLPEWRNVRLRSDLHDATGLPVLLDKDVTAAATAELRGREGTQDFLFLYLGSGVGAAVVAQGRVLRGTGNNIGEIGDIIVDRDAAPLDWQGRPGSLASVCVPEALALRAADAGVIPRPAHDDYLAIDEACAVLCRRADEGDAVAAAILDEAAARVAVGIGVLVNFIDVPRVVLGGPLWTRLRSRFLPILRTAVPPELIVARDDFAVVDSAVGEQVAAEGAAELVMDHFLAPSPSVLVMD
jgi:predicted NBD/HSP70 family sugar kinase